MSELDEGQHRGVDRAGCSARFSPSRSSWVMRCGGLESAGIRPRDLPGGLVVCGMGGSAIGGDLALAALGDRATRPITVIAAMPSRRGFAGDAGAVLELLGQHRGDARRFEAAGAAGAQRVVITTGGKAGRARPRGGSARDRRAGRDAAAGSGGYMTIGALECAALCGAAPAVHAEIDTATALLEHRGVGSGRGR